MNVIAVLCVFRDRLVVPHGRTEASRREPFDFPKKT